MPGTNAVGAGCSTSTCQEPPSLLVVADTTVARGCCWDPRRPRTRASSREGASTRRPTSCAGPDIYMTCVLCYTNSRVSLKTTQCQRCKPSPLPAAITTWIWGRNPRRGVAGVAPPHRVPRAANSCGRSQCWNSIHQGMTAAMQPNWLSNSCTSVSRQRPQQAHDWNRWRRAGRARCRPRGAGSSRRRRSTAAAGRRARSARAAASRLLSCRRACPTSRACRRGRRRPRRRRPPRAARRR